MSNDALAVCRSWRVLLGWLAVLLTSCALLPNWKQLARQGDLYTAWVHTDQFRHLSLSNRRAASHLRIYVEGDGTPWLGGSRVSIDPTPVEPYLLRLMLDDPGDAVYLGRPCYFGSASDPGCGPRWWTSDRYSTRVIDSMCDAANQIVVRSGARTVHLLGYSGGGTIAVAMQKCTQRLVAVSTIAGNLLPARWTEHHRYTAVNYQPSESMGVQEHHWQCLNDTNIPPSITDDYFVTNPRAVRHLFDKCTHSRGWSDYMERILALDMHEFDK